MSCGVYAITNTKTGQQYVGSSVSIEARIKKHFSELRRGIHYNQKLQRAFDKYGPLSFETEVLGNCGRSVSERAELEQLWMDLLMVVERGYNICVKALTVAGTAQTPEHVAKRVQARTGKLHSDETKELLSRLAKENDNHARLMTPAARERAKVSLTGKTHSEETRAKLSEIAKQRPPKSEETRKKASETMKKVRASRFWSSGSFRSKRT